MLGRIIISMAMTAALCTAPMANTARSCILSSAPVQVFKRSLGSMKTKTFSLLLATSLLLGTQIAAEGGESGSASSRLSLTEVTRVVLANNPVIKEAENRWYAAIQRVRQAYAWDDPRVAGESRMRSFVDVPPNAFADQTLGIEQLIPITGKNLVRGRIAATEAFSAFQEARRAH